MQRGEPIKVVFGATKKGAKNVAVRLVQKVNIPSSGINNDLSEITPWRQATSLKKSNSKHSKSDNSQLGHLKLSEEWNRLWQVELCPGQHIPPTINTVDFTLNYFVQVLFFIGILLKVTISTLSLHREPFKL